MYKKRLKMKCRICILLLGILLVEGCGKVMAQHNRQPRAANKTGYWLQDWEVNEHGDSIPHIHLLPVCVYSRGVDLRRWNKLVAAVKKVYPVAQLAKEKMKEMEARLTTMESKQEQKAYIKEVYHQIVAEYTPVVKKMTRTQGRVLLKLIDRETDYTAYEILKEFRGGFVAGFWQTVGRVFGHNLKSDYDKEGEDRIIEQIVIYYEAGLL